ncbi:TetR/AcrR family transcriptional regulator [Niallia sp.]|uniref:TetR/AcrR family transcriptional regulator n=1 Tax=Niallia sp. TaxID=2837523 RepID=UPI00289E6EF5|nr:TetR/AcrR family transcriptional regulator [Niallia sp.]
MQVLKEEVRNRILHAAVVEFNSKGYSKASMRNIAKIADMTIGNIYRYYKNKEELFDAIVKPVYEQYCNSLESMRKKVHLSYSDSVQSRVSYYDKFEKTLMELFKSFTAEMSILFNNSEGSKYECVKEDLINLSFSALESMFLETNKNPMKGLSLYQTALAQMFATSLIEGICIILRDNNEGETFNKLMDQFISMYANGMKDAISKLKE